MEHETALDRAAYLYRADRMEDRLRLFETVALPGLKAQTDADFTLAILVGEDLPAPYLARLEVLVGDMPQARIVAHAPGPARQVVKRVFEAVRDDRNAPCLQFRHDDDDAVAVDFVARLRRAADDCAGLFRHNRTVAFDFSRGFTARFGPEGISAVEIHRPWIGVGMGMYAGPGVSNTILNFGHSRLPRFMPAVAFSDSPMWVRGHNDFNDSRQKRTATPERLEPLTPAQEADFKTRFAIDTDRVRARFSAG